MVQPDPITAAAISIIHGYNDAFNRGDVDGVTAAMTDDCIVETPMAPPEGIRIQGQEAVRALWNEFFQSASSMKFDTEDLFASGDRYLAQWTFKWVGQENQPESVRGVDLFKIRDGKVSEKLIYVKG